jgi:hypothetical protein
MLISGPCLNLQNSKNRYHYQSATDNECRTVQEYTAIKFTVSLENGRSEN